MAADPEDSSRGAKSNAFDAIKRHLLGLRERERIEAELFDVAIQNRVLKQIKYEVFIDTFNLFQHAYEALTPLFAVGQSYGEDGKPIRNRPSAAEYAKFSEVFLDFISSTFEDRYCSLQGHAVPEKRLKASIRELVTGSITNEDVPNSDEIISFERTVRLFGARFDKEEIASRIDNEIKASWRKKDLKTLARWQELKRRVIEDDAISYSGTGKREKVKRYAYYNDFLDHLIALGAESNLPGFYKYYLEDGAFSSHAEKGVDTSLAVASISTAFEHRTNYQIFCVSDTDYIPVFKKLEELGVPFLIVHVTRSDKVPREFQAYKGSGQLMTVDFESICSGVIDEFVELFIQGGDALYVGENGHIYDLLAKLQWTEMNEEWQAALREQSDALWRPIHEDD